jgi:carnosine N-methyltransferase
MQAGDFLVEYSHEECRESYDGVATVFFMDTANNILDYVQQIARLLKPGGIWVNLGPLLYHYSDMNTFGNKRFPSLELTYEELKGTFEAFGLRLIKEKSQHHSTYNDDHKAMSTQVYHCVLFTCVKDPSLPVAAELAAPPGARSGRTEPVDSRGGGGDGGDGGDGRGRRGKGNGKNRSKRKK